MGRKVGGNSKSTCRSVTYKLPVVAGYSLDETLKVVLDMSVK